MRHLLPLVALSTALALPAQYVVAPFDANYQVANFGTIPNIYNYGGTAFVPGNPGVLLVGSYNSGHISIVPLSRDAQNHINGFGPATQIATVGGPDGGLAFGPTGVLFSTWFGPNRLSQIKPGSFASDRDDELNSLGVNSSVGACTFVPAGLPGAGRLKVASWSYGDLHDVPLTPDGNGTFAPGIVNTTVTLVGGPEGLVYVPAGAPQLGGRLLVCEWNTGSIVAYQIDAIGDPLPATRQEVVLGAVTPGGGSVDPVTGDIAFLQVSGQLVVLRTGVGCGTETGYGVASPGALGTPTISGVGCANRGQSITVNLGGPSNGIGLLAYGAYQYNFLFQNLTVLQSFDGSVLSILSPTGTQSIPIAVPNQLSLSNAHLYLQGAYLDGSTLSGLISSPGLDIWIR